MPVRFMVSMGDERDRGRGGDLPTGPEGGQGRDRRGRTQPRGRPHPFTQAGHYPQALIPDHVSTPSRKGAIRDPTQGGTRP